MLESSFYREELLRMRENYDNNPLDDMQLNCPKWIDSRNPMSEIYSKKWKLLQQGEIVYAYLVQANDLLFKRFPPIDCPAQIVYSTDPYFSENPEVLYDIAWKIYSYKGQTLDTVPEEWRDVARVITDEHDSSDFAFSLCLDSQSFEYRMIPTMIHRKLLPKRKLCGNILPVLAVPECKQVFVLPKQYWTERFTKAWVARVI